MRKIVLRRYGGPGVLEVQQVAEPDPSPLGPGDVLVRASAAGVNPVDGKTRSGTDAAAALSHLPISVGWDLAGVVRGAGADVSAVSVGDRVYGMAAFPLGATGYAEQLVVAASDLLLTPDHLSDEEAAALPLGALTAWQDLVDIAGLSAGQRVLILGAGGGVGHLAVQIAMAVGATVIAMAGRDKVDWLRGLGADLVIDRAREDVAAVLRNDPVDVVLDGVSGKAGAVALGAVRSCGVFVDLPGHLDPGVAERGRRRGVRVENPAVHNDRHSLERVGELVDAGRLVPRIARVFDLDDVSAAHTLLDAGHLAGKIVLSMR